MATVLCIVLILGIIVLKPNLTYAHVTKLGNFTVFDNRPLEPQMKKELEGADALLKKSELYTPTLKLEICLSNGMIPGLLRAMTGPAFGWGFYKMVVLRGNMDCAANFIELNGYKWNLTQLLTHEMVHCFQFERLGLWKSNPFAHIPNWKWEGYPEYIARQHGDGTNLPQNIDQLVSIEQTENNGWIQFPDSTGTVIPYYKSRLLIAYCMEVKGMDYRQILNDTSGEQTIWAEMSRWRQTLKH